MKLSWTAFQGDKRITGGSPAEVVTVLKARHVSGVLIFDDVTGRLVDLDLRGDLEECLARLPKDNEDPVEPAERRPGRPKLGVVAREVTLLPRHWEWLNRQSGGASVALRKLVEAARAAGDADDQKRQAQEAADRFMQALAGDQPGYEEAARALYAGQAERFEGLTAAWPKDIRDHAVYLAKGAFEISDTERK